MSVVRGAIPAAAGYPQYSGNLIHPMFGQELIERFYQTSIFGDITTTEYIGQLAKGGDQITFWREPTVIIRDAIKDGTIVHDTLESETVTLVIDKAKEFSIKIAKIDEKQMMMWPAMKAAILKNAARAMAQNIDAEILGSIYVDSHAANQGAAAGMVSQSYNLGAAGAPVPVTPSNIIDVLTDLHGVLNEAAIPRDNRWVILPTVAEVALLRSDLKAAYLTGMSESPMLNGRLSTKVAGFNIYVSDHVSRVFDSGVGAWCHNIIAGTNQATVFASQLEDTRVIEDKDSWSQYMQGLQVYGFDVIQPTCLSWLYARF